MFNVFKFTSNKIKNKTMKHLLNLTKVALIALTLFTSFSCDEDDDNIIDVESNTIADFVTNNPDYSSLLAALQQTGLDATLAGNGDFTVFAPNNAAFDAFLGGTALADVDNDLLSQVLLNHVLSSAQLSTDFSTGYVKNLAQEESTGANIDLYVDVSAAGVMLNGQSSVTAADIQTDNGIIHAVDTVIDLPTIVTFATTNPALTDLVGALTAGGNTAFVDLLSDTEQDFTVFAPTNDAFGAFTNPDSNDIAQVLSNHVVVGTVALSSGLSNSYINTAAVFNGEADAPLSLYINTDDGVVLNGSSTVAAADIVASNGVVHVVDTVIDLPNITTFATADPTFGTLVEALASVESDSGFIAALQTPNGTSPAPFTVFAPTNDAFADLLTDLEVMSLGEIDPATVSATLALHVITETNVRAEDLAGIDGANVETLAGTDVTIDASTPAIIDPDGGSNTIIATNVQAANGVIHAVSRVLRDL